MWTFRLRVTRIICHGSVVRKTETGLGYKTQRDSSKTTRDCFYPFKLDNLIIQSHE